MTQKLIRMTYTTTSVANTTWVKILPAKRREHLYISRVDTTNDFRLFFKDNHTAAPSGATDGNLYNASHLGEFWDQACPQTEVWAYQSSGGAMDVTAREGFVSEDD